MPRSPKGRAAARGLDARLSLQHAFMPAGDASLKTAQLIKMLVDSNHGIYRYRQRSFAAVLPMSAMNSRRKAATYA